MSPGTTASPERASSSDPAGERGPDAVPPKDRTGQLDLVATLLLALATILTAWSAFQSAKWSGSQSIHFADASARRTESVRASATAEAQKVVDVSTFVSWVTALDEERKSNPKASMGPGGSYVPQPNTLSGFLFERLRAEFRPAIEAWIAEHPLTNPNAAPTPFQLPQYKLAASARADRLEREADHQAFLARRDNQRSDDYVMMTVLFASVLFFAGISTKITTPRSRTLIVGLGLVVLLVGAGILVTFPVQF